MLSRIQEVDQYLERVVMAKVLAAGETGILKSVVAGYLNPWGGGERAQLDAECPG